MLKTALKITPDQETKWNGVAQAMRDSASKMEKLVAEKRAIPPEKTTAVDDLKTYQEFTEVRLDGLKKVNSAFKSLYDSMPAEQKKNADAVFEKYGPTKPATQG
jgi:periplasmic protein CpxP/Spy